MRRGLGWACTLVLSVAVLMPAACTGTQPPTCEPDAPSAAALPDGDHSGFVVAFDGCTITLDPAEKLLDDEAPNRFRIDNPDDAQLLLDVAASATVALIDNVSIQHRDVDLATLDRFFNGERPDWAYGSPGHLFAEIELREGKVVSVEEVYLP